MKLLLDENLSRRVVPFILQDYPESSQISLLSMEHSSDKEIWDYAQKHGYIIVTKDADFLDMSLLYGQPLKLFG